MRTKLWPKIKPYRKGYLKVSDGYKLYYELCGNEKGKPVLFVHGGPGAGCSENDRRFFNPKKYSIILFDQRGAGRSKPFASIKANTTWKLVEDINKLLQFLKIDKVFLFGGSWGSTLSLIYATNYPETVTGMLLRGIFLGTKPEIKFLYGGAAALFFPDAWERLASLAPAAKRNNLAAFINYYLNKMLSKNKEEREKYTYEWARYELSLLKLNMPEKEVRKTMKEFNYRSLAVLEAHYLGKSCFLPQNYILKNCGKLKIPVSIVHGRYDVICAPSAAYALHKKLKQSKLFFTLAGHGSRDEGNVQRLVSEMERMHRLI